MNVSRLWIFYQPSRSSSTDLYQYEDVRKLKKQQCQEMVFVRNVKSAFPVVFFSFLTMAGKH